jgi:hypothetical protein
MVGVRDTLKSEAERISIDKHTRADELRRELTLHDEARAKLRADLDNNAAAGSRVYTYKAIVEGVAQCPRCWMLHGRQEPMLDQGSIEEGSSLKCRACGLQVSSGS